MKLEKKYSSLTNIIKKRGVIDIDAVNACFKLLSAGNRIDKECAQRLGLHQLSEGRFMVLALLSEYEVLSPLEIANFSGVTKPTITSLIASLERECLIKRNNVPTDGRKIEISLTGEGSDLINKIFEEHSHWIVNITKNLTESEMKTLVSILDKMFMNTSDD
ncbi:MarR family winged helix-turn-helix transcriptional regulator [Erwinia sp. AnSW2-5]|uniref:MarR family winged helix-turn-helix transcriptional regulator n=1 Tax=Erwinia sp. AnSW2-5 TaxID=3367692 RepID=UPI00385825DF